ncbi:MAG TPA: 4-(cytidine 5'-diphospho)-2-C-methyl-D-erythritol kinase [Candidatus Rubrimentiphilum sp.]|nr:4-(cytidine 5'-diphospho)-2-C-methyl-D-erythritol kinase [Candidatus Rubrimentiphilum sp.]
MNATVLRAPAKLNLSLEVLNRQTNGLHALRSVMVPVDLCDEISVRPDGRLTFTCDDPNLTDNNLVVRAWHELRMPAGAAIDLKKHIPTGAGLGGGSSDAAALLLAAQRGALGDVPAIDYLATAKKLGSDVPFFLVETAALVEGTGERITALGRAPNWHAVILKPPDSISTAAAYAALDKRDRTIRPRNASVSLQLAEALQREQFDRVVELLQNDFLDVHQTRPGIARALNILRDAGGKPMLTGSGSAVFALTRDANACDTISEQIAAPSGFRVMRARFWSGESWTR